MYFCNLGYIIGDTFVAFSEHVSETKQVVVMVRSIKRVLGELQASLHMHLSFKAPWVSVLWTVAVPLTFRVNEVLRRAPARGVGWRS